MIKILFLVALLLQHKSTFENKSNTECLDIIISKITCRNNIIHFDMTFTNRLNTAVLLYKPQYQDAKFNIVDFQLINSQDTINIYKGNIIYDLESINLNKVNSQVIRSNSDCLLHYKININKFEKKVKSGAYRLKVYLNYKDVNFVTNSKFNIIKLDTTVITELFEINVKNHR